MATIKSIEEKAKAYDMALENAKHYHSEMGDDICCVLEECFPELKESEDERIWTINYLNNRKLNSSIIEEKESLKKAIAWLEKQGEQKSTDKVEPKSGIEKGKWYVCNTPRYRDFVVGKAYYCPKNGMLKPNENEMARYVARHCFHIWTIKDAKDGDVLVTKDIVFIFKHMDKTGLSLCKSYCEVVGNSKLGLGFDFSISGVYPATKKQHDFLFQKMKEAGYEWDTEKKELKKIEQNPTNEVGNYDHKEVLQTIINEQKSAWSEEDEYVFRKVLDWMLIVNPTSSIFEKLPKKNNL